MKTRVFLIILSIFIIVINTWATTYDFTSGTPVAGETSCEGSGTHLDLTIHVFEEAVPCADADPWLSFSGTAYFQQNAIGESSGHVGYFTIEKTSGATLTANSVIMTPVCYPGETATIYVKAYNNIGTLVGTYTKSGIYAPSGSPAWTTITFSEQPGFQYENISKLEFGAGKQMFRIDDLVMDEASLPVELSLFSANVQGKTVLLNWQTESETDNLGFILQRAVGNEDWRQIASYKTDAALKGRGNSSTTTIYTFTDNTVSAGAEYRYRLGDVNVAGIVTMHSLIAVTMTALPQSTELLNAYPNPFNPETTIKYTLHQDAQVTITVYDLLGRQVKTLVDEQQPAGSYQAVWNGTDAVGAQAASGAYLVRMETAEVTQTQKVLLVK